MSFLDPLLLFGLLAVVIPLVIHLLDRRRPRRVRFAALEFILRSQRRSSRRFRIRQLLLLLARTTLIAALVLALARPRWLTDVPSLGGTGLPTASVVVLDDSLSMQLRDEEDGPTRFAQARELAEDVFAGMRPQDSGALLLAGATVRSAVEQLVFDRNALLDALARVSCSFRATDLAGAIAQATTMLAGSPLPRKRIIVVSDLQAAGFDAGRLPPRDPQDETPPEVLLLRVGQRDVLPVNRAVVAVEIAPAPVLGPLAYSITAQVATFDPAPAEKASPGSAQEVQIRLEVDGQLVNAGTVALAGGQGSKEFLHRFDEPGLHRGSVLLTPDLLPGDDRRDFVVQVQRELKVLLVNGDPRPTPQDDELFYLERALHPGDDAPSRFRPTVIGVPLLSGTSLAGFDVVVLANVTGLSGDMVGELEQYVRRGGGLLLTAGDNVEVERYNEEMLPLLSRRLRDVYRSPAEQLEVLSQLAALPSGDPLLRPLHGPAGEGLRAARFQTYLLLEPGGEATRSGLVTHLSLASGAPLLVEARLGQGILALLTTTVDRGWTDLPIRTGFLPLLHELLQHLSGAEQHGIQPPVLVGQSFAVPRPEWVQRALLLPPGGRPRTLSATELAHRPELTVEDTEQPGPYVVRLLGGPEGTSEELARAVVTDAAESNPAPLRPEELAVLGGPGPGEGGAEPGGTQRAVNLWPWALLLLLLLLLAEALLLLRQPGLVPGQEQGGGGEGRGGRAIPKRGHPAGSTGTLPQSCAAGQPRRSTPRLVSDPELWCRNEPVCGVSCQGRPGQADPPGPRRVPAGRAEQPPGPPAARRRGS
ncbi:MAG: VWA domain-containing protein [Deltaproteobacteria bacterium]|nr:VWA domain-containing protein [Deltaproteobacteria bacterium]